MTIAAGARYHKACFCCSNCKEPLKEYVMHASGNVHCTACFASLYNDRCVACNEVLEAGVTYMVVDDLKYHRNCFVCTLCCTSLEQFVVCDDGQRYCPTCGPKAKTLLASGVVLPPPKTSAHNLAVPSAAAKAYLDGLDNAGGNMSALSKQQNSRSSGHEATSKSKLGAKPSHPALGSVQETHRDRSSSAPALAKIEALKQVSLKGFEQVLESLTDETPLGRLNVICSACMANGLDTLVPDRVPVPAEDDTDTAAKLTWVKQRLAALMMSLRMKDVANRLVFACGKSLQLLR